MSFERVDERIRALELKLDGLQSELHAANRKSYEVAPRFGYRIAEVTSQDTGNTFTVKFIDGLFTQSPGLQTPAFKSRQITGNVAVHNLAGETPPYGTKLLVFNWSHRWWTHWSAGGGGGTPTDPYDTPISIVWVDGHFFTEENGMHYYHGFKGRSTSLVDANWSSTTLAGVGPAMPPPENSIFIIDHLGRSRHPTNVQRHFLRPGNYLGFRWAKNWSLNGDVRDVYVILDRGDYNSKELYDSYHFSYNGLGIVMTIPSGVTQTLFESSIPGYDPTAFHSSAMGAVYGVTMNVDGQINVSVPDDMFFHLYIELQPGSNTATLELSLQFYKEITAEWSSGTHGGWNAKAISYNSTYIPANAPNNAIFMINAQNQDNRKYRLRAYNNSARNVVIEHMRLAISAHPIDASGAS